MTNLSAATRTQCEITVTPLIDVLLVLLIIFMIITPSAPHGLPAFVPQENTNAATTEDNSVVLELRSDHSLRLNSQALSLSDLPGVLVNVYATRANKALFIQADQDLDYRDVAQLIDAVQGINPALQIGLTKSSL